MAARPELLYSAGMSRSLISKIAGLVRAAATHLTPLRHPVRPTSRFERKTAG